MLSVEIIASTEIRWDLFNLLEVNPNDDDGYPSDPEVLSEFAGRACYLSWGRKNPETARTDDYIIRNILDKGHESVLEHPTVSFWVTGISRSAGYELLRHRHLSRSELSQRYVPMAGARYVMPPLVAELLTKVADARGETWERPAEEDRWQLSELWRDAREGYDEIEHLIRDFADEVGREVTDKEVREAARACLPNATETSFVVTGNLRAWRHVVKLRGALDADAEVREFAVSVYRLLSDEAPAIWADMEIGTADDGREFIRERSLTPAALDGAKPFREQTPGDLGIAAPTDD